MIRHEFPDLEWKQKMASQAFSTRQGEQVRRWPNVTLNAKTNQCFRPDIKGPLSLFLNLSGTSYVKGEESKARVDERHFFLTNREEVYTLHVSSESPVETFNLHFGDAQAHALLKSQSDPIEKSWDQDYTGVEHPGFFTRIYQRTPPFDGLITRIRSAEVGGRLDQVAYDEAVANLLAWLANDQWEMKKRADAISAAKKSTRVELYRRLNHVIDFLHSHFEKNLRLDELAAVASMSKYHFLRLFREAFRQTPHQYLQEIRIKHAAYLLKNSGAPISQVGLCCGFETLEGFSRAFRKFRGMSPSAFVRMHESKKFAILVNS